MRRPVPPPVAAIAPPPRRRSSGSAGPPPRAPAARPRPPRSPRDAGRRPPNRARRRSIAVALLLTVVILVGYGGYLAYDKITGSETATSPTGDGYITSTQRAMYFGGVAIGTGIDLRNLRDMYLFKDGVNGQIDIVRTEEASLEGLLPTATGPQADAIRATMRTMDELAAAMAQWRDTIFLLRLGNVATAQSAIESAIAQLGQQLDTWNSLEGN